jgi:hypothetical protein
MKPTLLATAIALLASTQASIAHPGDHDHFAPLAWLEHVMSSPFHALAWMLGGLSVLGVIVLAQRARCAQQRDR